MARTERYPRLIIFDTLRGRIILPGPKDSNHVIRP